MIRILLVDAHPLIRIGIRTMLEQEQDLLVVGEAANETEVRCLCGELSPQVLLLDVRMPDSNAASTVRFLQECCPQVKVIILSAIYDEAIVRAMVQLGIAGYVLKDEAPETLVRAIRTVKDGNTWFSRSVTDILAKPVTETGRLESHTDISGREGEVLRLMAQGLPNSQIAETLGIAEGTVKNHVMNIYDKLGVHSRAEAVAWFWTHRENQ